MLLKKEKAALRTYGVGLIGDNWWDLSQYKALYVELTGDYTSLEEAKNALAAEVRARKTKFVVASPSSSATYSSQARVDATIGSSSLAPNSNAGGATSAPLAPPLVKINEEKASASSSAPAAKSWASMATKAAALPTPAAAAAPTRQQRMEALAETIKIKKADIEEICVAKLNGTGRFVVSGEMTVCLMWSSKAESYKDFRFALSGGGGGRTSLTPDKETVCAEDNILSDHPGAYYFSLAYDKTNGFKPACRKGCADLLKKNGIIDLYFSIEKE